jgi:hypothetical protein
LIRPPSLQALPELHFVEGVLNASVAVMVDIARLR